jgi:hypothetical protein
MTREAKQDLEALRKFVADYDLSLLEKSSEFSDALASQHLRYLGLLTLLVEFSDQLVTLKQQKKDSVHLPTEQQILFLRESVSDIGQSLFCWIHGAYKANRIMLRSAIETFVKGMSLSEIPAIITEKSVYKAFELAPRLRSSIKISEPHYYRN